MLLEELLREENKIWIFGAGNIATALVTIIQNDIPDWENRLNGCVVSSYISNPTELLGVKVHEIDSIVVDINAVFIVAVRHRYANQVTDLLKKKGISNAVIIRIQDCINELERIWEKSSKQRYAYYHKLVDYYKLSDEERAMFIVRQLRTGVLEDLEVNLADHCNLNCQCCNHFSPIASEEYLDPEAFAKDIHRVSFLFNGRIRKMMLLGGEPLLNVDIVPIMRISRTELPMTTIRIITNGLLLPKMNQGFWDSCRENDIQIMITKYPISFDYSKCEYLAEINGVRLGYGYLSEPIKTTYRLPIHENGDLNAASNFIKCDHANRCVVLKKRRIYTCPLGAYVNHLNSFFGLSIPEESDNSISVYDVGSYKEIEEFIKRPIPMCSHCDIYHYEYNLPWAQSNKDIDEWIEK